MRFTVILVGGGLAGFSVFGCSRTDSLAAGRTVFEANRCARCHTIAGQDPGATAGGPGEPGPGGEPTAGGNPGGGPAGRGRGPELTTVGAKHTHDWLIEQVRNPKAHNPRPRMPAFEGKINDTDLQALADYLASLK